MNTLFSENELHNSVLETKETQVLCLCSDKNKKQDATFSAICKVDIL